MQHIGIVKMDERGKVLDRSEVNFADFMVELYKMENYKSKFPLMAYVDPYGDTYLNILQRPDFIEELKRFNFNEDTKNELIKFLESADTHDYIRFIGD